MSQSKRPGRPRNDGHAANTRASIVYAAVRIIAASGARAVTVRAVCDEAGVSNGTFYHHFANKDELMATFVHDSLFGSFEPSHTCEQIAERTLELYMHLVNGYMSMGRDFMRSFYTTDNRALSAYMGESGGTFPEGTIMARNEADVLEAQRLGVIAPEADAHQICADICTMVKGCVFEWCLEDDGFDIEATLGRMIENHLAAYRTVR
ncbi:MAG: TetR/AcrR family transcriptional regulator [Coriobacteriales bacterium]|jgi:AcrR family transcriptional regulator